MSSTSEFNTAYPRRQLKLLLACRLVEPLAINSVIPYLFQLVQHVSPDSSPSEATRLVSLIFSSYAIGQFGTNILWGRLCDYIGRRPVLLFGLAGVFVSTVVLAFSSSIELIFASRIAAGILSGNVVITRTMIGDMVHGHANKSRAFAWNQTVYQIGVVIGPFLGGYLADPCTQIPGLCSKGRFGFLRTFPYALPNLLIAGLIATSFTVAYFFLNESLERATQEQSLPPNEVSRLLSDIESPSPSTESTRPVQIFTSNVKHIITCYGIMALHSVCFDQITPVVLTTPVSDASSSWLQPAGGLGFSPMAVASYISAAGLLSIALMVFVFPSIDARFGSLTCLRASLALFPLVYLCLPYLVLLPTSPEMIRRATVGVLFAIRTVATVFSFNDSAILLNMAAPSPEALGFVNGVAQTAANGARALGPASMGFFVGLSDKLGTNALGWWFLAVVAMAGVWQASLINDEKEEN